MTTVYKNVLGVKFELKDDADLFQRINATMQTKVSEKIVTAEVSWESKLFNMKTLYDGQDSRYPLMPVTKK